MLFRQPISAGELSFRESKELGFPGASCFFWSFLKIHLCLGHSIYIYWFFFKLCTKCKCFIHAINIAVQGTVPRRCLFVFGSCVKAFCDHEPSVLRWIALKCTMPTLFIGFNDVFFLWQDNDNHIRTYFFILRHWHIYFNFTSVRTTWQYI